MLAVSYNQYSTVSREKFRKLYMHRRLCMRQAFKLLNSNGSTSYITFKNFLGVVKIIKPGVSPLRCYLMFKLCDSNRSGTLTLKQFYRIYDALELNWTQIYPEVRWYNIFNYGKVWKGFDALAKFSKSQTLEKSVDFVLILALIFEVMSTSKLLPNVEIETELVYSLFIGIFMLEAFIKILGSGFVDYITSDWNPFDFMVTAVSVIGHYIQPFGNSFGYFYLLRTFRILRIFEKTKKYKHIMGPFVFIIIRQLTHFSVIIFVLLYSFSLVGMVLFAKTDLSDPPLTDFPPGTPTNEYYKLNNFSNILTSFRELLNQFAPNYLLSNDL